MAHNSWSNRETEAVYLWLSNDDEIRAYWIDLATNIFEDMQYKAEPTYETEIRLTDWLQEELQAGSPPIGDGWLGLYSDLLGFSLEKVDCKELATAFLNAAKDKGETQ